jgi:hypothetical protein
MNVTRKSKQTNQKQRKKFKGKKKEQRKLLREEQELENEAKLQGEVDDFEPPPGTTTKVFEAGVPWWRADSVASVADLLAAHIKSLKDANVM